jgi:C-terminal processing protease CtpA/Prc
MMDGYPFKYMIGISLSNKTDNNYKTEPVLIITNHTIPMTRIILMMSLLLLSIFNGIAQVNNPNTLTPADKVYGLSKFWQEVNYNFIYLDKVDRAMWDNRYKELITIVQNTQSDYDYYRELQKFCALLKDGHTNVYFPEAVQQFNSMFGEYRLFIEHIDHKAIIVRTNFSKKDEIPVGSEIIEVNGRPTEQHRLENVVPYIASSTDYVLEDESYERLLQGREGERFTLKIKTPRGSVNTLTLTHKRTEEKELYPAAEDGKLFDLKWYPNQIAYIALNSFADPKIDTLFIEKLPELYKAKALIIDLRQNGGGSTNVGLEILQYLTNDSVLYGSRYKSRLHIPSFKAWGKYSAVKDTVGNPWATKSLLTYLDRFYYHFDYSGETIKLDAKRLVVPTTILIGHRTASAAEDFLIYADGQKHMVKIGANSFGSTGQPFLFDLPGGGLARICTKQDTYPDGREFVGYGVKPDIEVIPTLKDFLNKKDPVLNKALQYLGEKIN